MNPPRITGHETTWRGTLATTRKHSGLLVKIDHRSDHCSLADLRVLGNRPSFGRFTVDARNWAVAGLIRAKKNRLAGYGASRDGRDAGYAEYSTGRRSCSATAPAAPSG